MTKGVLSPARWLPALLVAPALALCVVFFLVPLLETVMLSFHPFDSMKGIGDAYTLENYTRIIFDSFYLRIFGRTMAIASVVTVLAAFIGVPEAYILHRLPAPWNSISLVVVLGPLLISVVVRTFGWAVLLGNKGLLNDLLLRLGLITEPLQIMYTETAIVIGMVHVLVPFMVIAVWTSLHRQNREMPLAARSLGANAFTVFRRILLPQIMPGILSGSLIVFSLAASSFATPAILGSKRVRVVATVAYEQFLNTLNWPFGAAVTVLLLLLSLALLGIYARLVEGRYRRYFGAGVEL